MELEQDYKHMKTGKEYNGLIRKFESDLERFYLDINNPEFDI